MAFIHKGAGDPHQHDTVAEAAQCSDLYAECMAEQAWEAECEVAYARSREAIAEAGTWFGRDAWEDHFADSPEALRGVAKAAQEAADVRAQADASGDTFLGALLKRRGL